VNAHEVRLAAIMTNSDGGVAFDAPGQGAATRRPACQHGGGQRTRGRAFLGVLGTFGLNFPVVLTGMADSMFNGGAALYGLV
jgi:hypothetical protein